jgi:hypothetical protein
MDIDNIVDPTTLTESEFKKASKNVKAKMKKISTKPISNTNKCIATIHSENSKKKYKLYLISGDNNGIHFECDCGEQFGIGRRRNCKHIGTMIHKCTNSFFRSQIYNSENSGQKIISSKKRKHSSIQKTVNSDINSIINAFENLFCK